MQNIKRQYFLMDYAVNSVKLINIIITVLFILGLPFLSKSQHPIGIQTMDNHVILFGSDTVGSGIKTFWYPAKAAFRAGAVGQIVVNGNETGFPSEGSFWDPDSLGFFSFATGYSTKAIGSASFASGEATVACGQWSTAFDHSLLKELSNRQRN